MRTRTSPARCGPTLRRLSLTATLLLAPAAVAGRGLEPGPAPTAPAGAGLHFTLFVTVNGAGRVTSNRPTADSGIIDCPGSCAASIATGAAVTLTATPDAGWEFDGWSGDCIGTGTCTLTMDQTKEVSASFSPAGGGEPQTLTVEVDGDGDVSSSPAGIACPGDCTEEFEFGTQVSLSVSPDAGSSFGGWSGDCSGQSSCQFFMDRARRVKASFLGSSQSLTVTVVGQGTARSSPAGIVCPGDCTESYPNGITVTLTAAPDPDWLFAGWEGACVGTGSCRLTMDEQRAVIARFAQQTFPVAVSVTGQGSVASAPAGIDCPGACEASFGAGATVTLTADPAPGWEFEAWGDACAGADDCIVTVDGPLAVAATFRPATVTLTVALTGTGTVGSTPPGIACPGECALSLTTGSTIELAATPGADWEFAGWRGPCSGTGSCSLTLTEDVEVTAAFRSFSANVDTTSPGSADRVDGYDLARMLQGVSSGDPRLDLNGDGVTDLNDLNIVLQALGRAR